MNKTKKMRLQLAKLLSLYAEKPTEEGFVLVSENDFELGSEIFVVTEDGNIEVAPDGVYTVDTTVYTVADGLIASIVEKPTVAVVEDDKSMVDSEIEIIRKRLEEAEKTIKERDEQIGKLEGELKGFNDKLNETVAQYEKIIKEKDNKIAELEKAIADLTGKAGKPEVEETIEEETIEEEIKMRKNAPKTDGVALIKKFRNQ